jgi:hypothetical protein
MARSGLLVLYFFLVTIALKAQDPRDTSMHKSGVDSSTIDAIPVKKDATGHDVPGFHTAAAGLVKKSPYVTAGLSYMNDNVYLGRKDSTVLPYLTFDMAWYGKKGLFLDGSVNYLASSSQNRVDAVNFTAGYTFDVKKYSGTVSVSKYFYSSQSTNVRSNVTGSISYFNSYDLGWITPTATVFLDFGTKTDVGASLGLEYTFYAADDKLDVTPTVTINISSLNFYSNYYKTKRFTTRKKKNPVTGTANISGVVENADALKVLDYEISAPAEYKAGRFTMSLAPTYSIPVNPSVLQVTTTRSNNTGNTKIVTEKIANTFFMTAGVSYKFGR